MLRTHDGQLQTHLAHTDFAQRHSATRSVAIGALFALIFLAPPAWATDTVTIAETTRMDFGTVAIPASGGQYLALNPSNSVLTGTGNKLFGMPSRGAYTLTSSGNTSTSITIDIINVATNSANLTLDNFDGIYNGSAIGSFPSSPQALPSTTGTAFYLGARETVSAGMSPSAPNPSFDIVVIVN
jgi:hypothetical protein